MLTAQFAWVHLIAALVLGLSMGWNVAIHVWNLQVKKTLPKPDPLSLEERFKRAVVQKQKITLLGNYEIQGSTGRCMSHVNCDGVAIGVHTMPATLPSEDRYREITFERVEEDE